MADPAPAGLRPALAETGEALAERAGRSRPPFVGSPTAGSTGISPEIVCTFTGSLSPGGIREPVVEERVVRVVEALMLECARDQDELLEELDHHVHVDVVLLRELDRDHEHRQRVVRHPRGAVGLLERNPLREVGAIDRADVVETEKAAAEDVVAVGVLAVQPPGEVDEQLLEDALQELAVAAAVDAVDADRRHHVHRRIDVVEVPLVCRQRPVRVLEPLAQQHQQLVLRERGVEVRPGNRVEAEIPGREPRVLPRIRHREHVERVEVAPAAVAPVLARLRRRRRSGIPVQPAAHVVGVDLLAPDEPGARLAQDLHLLRPGPVRRQRAVELLRIRLARGHRLVERPAGPVRAPAWRRPGDAGAAGARRCRRQARSADNGTPPWCRSRPG